MSQNKNIKDRPADKKRMKLALQGGGSHGAFTWGVLDRVFEDSRLEIEAIVGTSAGAMNAVVAAYGFASGGGAGARAKLAEFWHAISDVGRTSLLQPSLLDRMLSLGNMTYSPTYHVADALSRTISPYQLNPNNVNPLKDILCKVVDFEYLHNQKIIEVFVCATNVLTGRLRVFPHDDISPDAIMASACLPHMFQAVEVAGEYFWDGGYCGNPPIFPLISNVGSKDILLVQIEPINIPDVPRTSADISDRIKTLSFNSSLMREMRAIHFVSDLIDKGELDGSKYSRILMHTIDAELELGHLSASSKLNADMEFITHLFHLGRRKAETFLDAHFDDIGVRGTTDIEAKFM